MDAWEALDIDESDIPSVLRPCKRQSCPPPPPPPPPPSSVGFSQEALVDSSPRIPGPAGALQAALMQRRNDPHCSLPTQEYIRKVAHEGFPHHDDLDFKNPSWLLAGDFVRRLGTIEQTPLCSIRRSLAADSIPLVVAIIKSYTPNYLGDFIVTLKDPTGTIGATIHHKVLTEGKFGGDISLGSVLILQKVAVFSPTRSTCYLNISLSNVVKVFSTGNSSLSQKNNSSSTGAHFPAPGTDRSDKSWMPQNGSVLLQRRIEEIMTNVGLDAYLKRSVHTDQPIQKVSCGRPKWRYCRDESIRNLSPDAVKGPVSLRWDDNARTTEAAVGADAEQMDVDDDNHRKSEEPNNARTTEAAAEADTERRDVDDDNHRKSEEPNDCVVRRIDGANMKQPLIFRDSLPEWTDEQLAELFAADSDNDGSLF